MLVQVRMCECERAQVHTRMFDARVVSHRALCNARLPTLVHAVARERANVMCIRVHMREYVCVRVRTCEYLWVLVLVRTCAYVCVRVHMC